MEKEFLTLDDLTEPKGKKVLVRADINAAIKDGKVMDGERFEAHAETIRELALKGARVVVLAHQGRAEDADFIPLEQHAAVLSKHVRKKVKYVDDILGSKARKAIAGLSDGKVILLENVRFLAEEGLDGKKKTFKDTLLVKTLSPQVDVFVNDAFSAAHRAQTSLIGFAETLPSYAGRVMQREYEAVKKSSEPEKPCIYLLGGGKPDEPLQVMDYVLGKGIADKVLVSGVLGELCLIALGKNIGAKKKWLEDKKYLEFLPRVQKLVNEHKDKIVAPIDFAYEDKDGFRVEAQLAHLPQNAVVFDVGSETIKLYSHAVKQAKTVYFKGPLGAFERPAFELGTKSVLKAVQESRAFTVIGGGHTSSALQALGLNPKKFSHVSVAGGALLAMLCGKEMPAIEALKNAKQIMPAPAKPEAGAGAQPVGNAGADAQVPPVAGANESEKKGETTL